MSSVVIPTMRYRDASLQSLALLQSLAFMGDAIQTDIETFCALLARNMMA